MHGPCLRDSERALSGIAPHLFAMACCRSKAQLDALETRRAHSLSVTADNGAATFSSDLRSASTPQIAATTAAPIINAEPTR